MQDLAEVAFEVKQLLQDSKNHFFALAELACKHSAPSDTISKLWRHLDSAYDQGKTNEKIDKFVSHTKGVGSYKGKIAAGNCKTIKDLFEA